MARIGIVSVPPDVQITGPLVRTSDHRIKATPALFVTHPPCRRLASDDTVEVSERVNRR